MKDIVKRMRFCVESDTHGCRRCDYNKLPDCWDRMVTEGADEIEKLRKEYKGLDKKYKNLDKEYKDLDDHHDKLFLAYCAALKVVRELGGEELLKDKNTTEK